MQDRIVKDHFNAEIKKPTVNLSLRTLSPIDPRVSRVPSGGAAGGNYPKMTPRQYLSASFFDLFSHPVTNPLFSTVRVFKKSVYQHFKRRLRDPYFKLKCSLVLYFMALVAI